MPIPFCLLAPAAVMAAPANPIDIGSRLELFVDEFLIDRMDGVGLLLHHPTPREQALAFDAPWEGPTSCYVTVFRDGDRYRMYYRGSGVVDGRNEVACTAESADGIRWTRPELGLFEVDGSAANNVVWTGPGSHAFVPFKDANPAANPDEAYKAVAPADGSNRTPLFGYVSPDGYRWKRIRPEPIITEGNFDSQNVAFWDPERGEYVCYFRAFRDGFRDIKRATSTDFVNWSEPEWLSYTGAPRQHLYTNAIAPYARAPHIYVGLPKRFVPERKAVASHGVDGVSDGLFMSSRDGLSFRVWPEAFMRAGMDRENWTDRNTMAAWGILELTPGELSIYYCRHMRHPTAHLLRTTIRTDGFVSAHAGSAAGTLVTKPITFTGRELVINYSTSAAGGVRVELQDDRGAPIPGFELEQCPAIYGDEIERKVSWKRGGDVSELAGKPVRIRFELADADLYSMRFRP